MCALQRRDCPSRRRRVRRSYALAGHPGGGTRHNDAMACVLFVCLQNAGRSQMSEALFERAAAGRHEARSAGTTPGAHVHPEVIAAMRELEIELARRRPQALTRALA